MYKFISSDMDGTILLNGAQTVDERTIRNVEKLTQMGVVFAPASGRQYPTLKRQFGRISEGLAYISENGAFVIYKNDVILKSKLDRELGLDIIREIYDTPNCEVLISGEQVSYLKPKTEGYLHRIRDVVKNKVVIVEDFKDIKEDFLKISACDLSGIKNSKDRLSAGFEGMAQIAVSGNLYLDFTAIGVNKGRAVKAITESLGIKREETASFGDNFNDIEMFHATGDAYCMNNAAEAVKIHAGAFIDNVNDIFERIIKENA